jgi:HSP20 family protein
MSAEVIQMSARNAGGYNGRRAQNSIVPTSYTLPVWTGDVFGNIVEEFRRAVDQILGSYSQWYGSLFPTAPLAPFGAATSPGQLPARTPVVDVIDQGDHYLVRAELPGFSKDMVDVNVSEDSLQISAQAAKESSTKEKNYVRRERAYSAFQRTITFPEEVVPSKVEGTMKDGVLELTLPKKEPISQHMRRVALK